MDDIAWGWPALSGEEPWSQGCDVFRAQPLLGERHGDGGSSGFLWTHNV